MQVRQIKCDTDHEAVIECVDASSGYHGFIAIHSTRLGPAVGGTRLLAYESREAALDDLLRLSAAMTFKAALAGVPFGGGKAVIVADDPLDRERVFRAHGRFIATLGGAFITGEDVGTTPRDILMMRQETAFAAGVLDPAPFTALGVQHAMRAALAHFTGLGSLLGRHIVIQGCGSVGSQLARLLSDRGARVTVCDVVPDRAAAMGREWGAATVAPSDVFEVEADIFAPCALGGILNAQTIPRLGSRIVVGAANNQLGSRADAEALHRQGVLYVPDYVANAGGIIHATREICGWASERCAATIEQIYDTSRALLIRAETENLSPAWMADQMALEKLGVTVA